MVGTRAVTVVPAGTVTAMVCAVSSIVPVAAGLAKLNAVIAFVELAAAVSALGAVGLEQPEKTMAATSAAQARILKAGNFI
jgi:hypothetical protein